MIWIFILFFTTLTVFISPFLPAIYEWKKRTDDKPLEVNSKYPTIIDYYLYLYQNFIEENFTNILQKYHNEQKPFEGKLNNGIEFYVTGKEGKIALNPSEIKNQKTQKVIIAGDNLSLPDNIFFQSKIYATHAIETGKKDIVDAIYSHKHIFLNKNTTLMRLLFSDETITISKNCILYGYAKANKSIQLLDSAKFQCLYAPKIYFGNKENISEEKIPKKALNVFSCAERKLSKKDFSIPANSEVSEHYVIKGKLTIQSNCKIKGNIKSYGKIHIGNNVEILGAIICEDDIEIGNDCILQGPVVSNKTIKIGKNCIVGTHDTEASFIGDFIYIGNNSLFCGVILAKTEGIFHR